MDLGLTDKVAFLCASSKGLGRVSAMEMAKEGAYVIISGRNEEELKKAKEEINQVSDKRADYVVCDITKEEDIKNAIQFTINKHKRIDILVNNSGGPPSGTFETIDDETWYKSVDLNLLSYIRFIREVLTYMKKQNNGRIINLASSSIKQPIPGLLLSNTMRAGVIGLSKSLANEFADYNILVNTIAPGRIATDRVKSLDVANAEKQGISVDEIQKRSENTIPLKRYGMPEEFGKVVAFVASDVSSYMTGSSILVDGGMVKAL